jgi:hypothetical protein
VAASEVAPSSITPVAIADGCSAGANRISLKLKAELKFKKPKVLQLSMTNEAAVVADGTSVLSQFLQRSRRCHLMQLFAGALANVNT